MKPPTEYERSLLDEIQRLKAELVQLQNKAHFAGIERDEARVARDFAEHRAEKLEAQCAEEKKYAEELAKDLCEMEDALGFKQDQTDANGAFVPTKVPWLERVRDLIAKEGEAGDLKAQCAEMRAMISRLISVLPHEREGADRMFASIDARQLLESADCGKGWRSPDEYASLEAKCAEMRRQIDCAAMALEFWYKMPNPTPAQIDVAREALRAAVSSDFGKGWVRAEELKPTLELLAQEHGPSIPSVVQGECPYCHEYKRLQKLVGEL